MVSTEKRLLWHPRRESKFVVGGGSQITLYEWTPDHPGIRQITSRHDLQHLKCFAWSPDPSFDDLVAVGNSSGKIELLRLEASRHSQRGNVLSSAQGVPLNVRNSRSCNSLAFCTAEPNYLASGLDKVRGDCSLIIWDVNTASAMLSINADQPSNHATVTSKRLPNPHIPQGDVGRGADPRILQQHASTETVSTVCFLPKSTHLLLAGISHRWLRLFDLRSPVPPTTNVSSKIQGIATDPFDPHRIACFGEGTVTLWDARRLQVPVLSFGERDASADGAHLRPNSIVAGVEFSSTRRGMLASLERDALYVRFWDILGAHAQSHDGEPSDEVKSSRDLGRGPAPGRKPWANLPWPSGSNAHQQVSASAKQQDPQTSIVLFDTRRTKSFPRPIASFALAPSPSQHPLTTNVMVVNKEGDLELYAIHDTPKPAVWSARGDLAVAAGLSYRILEGSHEVDAADDTQSSFLGNSHSATPGTGHHSRSREESILPGQQKSVASSNGTGKSGPVIPPPPQGKNTHLPLFGRGDEDGFPALGGSSSNLTAARPVAVSGNSTSGLTAHGASSSRKGRSDTHGEGGSRAPSISTSRVRRGSGARGIQLVMECDISMVMRKRALRGYGLSDPQHNMEIVRECDPSHSHRGTDMLIDLWAWIYHSHGYLSVPNSVLHGYDFGYQGLIGVWEGFAPLPAPANIDPGLGAMSSYFDIPPYHDGRRSHGPMDEFHGNFHAALGALVARRTGDRSWKPTIMTTKGLQRQICLQLVGWSLREDEMANTLARWEREGEISRAACWLVFTKQYAKAISLLVKSPDESHYMLSGTIAALVPHGSRTAELRENCERLIIRLQDPYFRAMLTHLAMNDWSEVLQEDALPFRERLAIAFQFLDDKAVTSYLRRCIDRAVLDGDVDGIVVAGLASKAGLDILQVYVDRTGDIQSAAVLGSYVCPPRNPSANQPHTYLQAKGAAGVERRVQRWVEGYRDLLDGFKMFHHRVGFDIERGQVGGTGVLGDWVPRQIIIRCNYCNKSVVPERAGAAGDIGLGVLHAGRPTACYHCNRALPRCSICLMTLSIVQDAAREAELLHSRSKDTIDDAIVMCQTCRHGGHVSHILDWFYGEDGGPAHDVCAVADCECRCADEI